MAQPLSGRKLPVPFYTRADTLLIARQLLGKLLVVPAPDRARVSGLIVETEAYQGPEDRASHAYNHRRTARTETMYARGGIAYVYFVYGMHYQFNVVTGRAEIPHAVLVRALEPREGLARMRQRRPGRKDPELTNGPGKLCQALGIDRRYNGAELTGESVWIADVGVKVPAAKVRAGPRIGIAYAGEDAARLWRFWIDGNPFVSRP